MKKITFLLIIYIILFTFQSLTKSLKYQKINFAILKHKYKRSESEKSNNYEPSVYKVIININEK